MNKLLTILIFWGFTAPTMATIAAPKSLVRKIFGCRPANCLCFAKSKTKVRPVLSWSKETIEMCALAMEDNGKILIREHINKLPSEELPELAWIMGKQTSGEQFTRAVENHWGSWKKMLRSLGRHAELNQESAVLVLQKMEQKGVSLRSGDIWKMGRDQLTGLSKDLPFIVSGRKLMYFLRDNPLNKANQANYFDDYLRAAGLLFYIGGWTEVRLQAIVRAMNRDQLFATSKEFFLLTSKQLEKYHHLGPQNFGGAALKNNLLKKYKTWENAINTILGPMDQNKLFKAIEWLEGKGYSLLSRELAKIKRPELVELSRILGRSVTTRQLIHLGQDLFGNWKKTMKAFRARNSRSCTVGSCIQKSQKVTLSSPRSFPCIPGASCRSPFPTPLDFVSIQRNYFSLIKKFRLVEQQFPDHQGAFHLLVTIICFPPKAGRYTDAGLAKQIKASLGELITNRDEVTPFLIRQMILAIYKNMEIRQIMFK